MFLTEKCMIERREEGVLVNCMGRGLTEIPDDLPEDTTVFIASQNNISSIPNGVLSKLVRLTYLDLELNTIVNISRETFRGLKRLKLLGIDNNKIKISQLESTTFKDLVNLETLRICSQDVRGEVSYNGPVFSPLGNLKYLYMDGLSNVTFDSDFSSLKSLELLSLSGNMTYIRDGAFNAFRVIDLRDISIHANLTHIESQVFSGLKYVKYLDLSLNLHLGFSVSKIWASLTSTNITHLYLELINTDKWIVLKHDFFHGLDNIRLQTLDLTDNQIVSIQRGFYRYVPHLENLILKKNHINSAFDVMCDACFLNNILAIDMSTQYRASLNIVNAIYPQVIDVHSSDLMVNYGSRCSLTCQNRSRDMGYMPIHFVFPSKIQTVKMGTALSVVSKIMPDIFVYGKNDLEFVDFSDNTLRELSGQIVFPDDAPTAVRFDFSDNQCSKINSDFWRDSGNSIASLQLQNNRLGGLLASQGNTSFLRWLTQIVDINLANNNIKDLPKYTFVFQINLVKLNLANNALISISFEISHMKNLTNLDLSGNLLTQLTDHAYHILNHNMNLSLFNNPLLCSCDTIDFLKWMDKMKDNLVSWNEYKCTYKGKDTTLKVLEGTILPDLGIACSSKTVLVASSITLLSLCLFIFIFVCLYRHRFEVKYAFIRLIWQRKKYDRLIRDDQLMYRYDAFVAYHKDDIWFVRPHMIKQLEETDSPLTLCIHERDFMPGGVIEENIIDAMESSRKTILVLTKNFLLSYWCDFEYHMARTRCMERGDDSIITIILEELPVRHISKPLLAWLKRRTYIEWPENSLEEPHFWKKLKEAIEN